MDSSRHRALSWEVWRQVDSLLALIEELDQIAEPLAPDVQTTLQDAVAALRSQLQAFGVLVVDSLAGAEAVTETQDNLARLIEQIDARSQDIQHHLRHILADQQGDSEARVAMLEAAWSQLEKVAQIAVQELSTQPQPPESS